MANNPNAKQILYDLQKQEANAVRSICFSFMIRAALTCCFSALL